MRYRFTARAALLAALALGLAPALASAPARAGTPAASPGPVVGSVTDISRSCPGSNAEPQQAADTTGTFLYEVWAGCGGIGFARSTDGGQHFRPPVMLPASAGAWDPAITVGPDGTVYASFMKQTSLHMFPVVVASFNHGRTFPQVSRLIPGHRHNYGDREFLAAAPNGTVYLTWNYGPSASVVSYLCTRGGSCSYRTGDLNIVVQKSDDFGLTWGPMIHVSRHFPAGGADSAPLVLEPDGKIDVEYQAYHVTNPHKLTLGPAHSYFTSSADGGATWTSPARIGPWHLSMLPREWWIDGAIGLDAADNLYVTWDSQHHGHDVGWLAFSTDGGLTWSAPVRVTPDHDNATHIVEVAGGPAGVAYVAWLTDNAVRGYALKVRAYSITQGWESAPVRVSRRFGNRFVWPGSTFGITALPPAAGGTWQLALSWGSAVAHMFRPPSQIFSTVVTFPG
jgi:hypothetical protein